MSIYSTRLHRILELPLSMHREILPRINRDHTHNTPPKMPRIPLPLSMLLMNAFTHTRATTGIAKLIIIIV